MTTVKEPMLDSVKNNCDLIEEHWVCGKALEIIYSNSVFILKQACPLFIHSSIHAFDK